MALSGSIQNTFRTGYALRLEWSATQNISANQSTVTSKLYLMSLGSSYDINASASKTSAQQYDNGAWSTESVNVSLSGNQKKLVNTMTFTLTHGGDGKKSFSLDAYLDIEVTLGSSYYSRIDIDQKTFTLDTIPRASSITSSANFTAGSDFTISVAPADSSFRHIARVYVDNVKVYETPSGSKFATKVTADIDHTTVFTELAQTSSKVSRIELDTYSGSTKLNSSVVSKSGTCTAPSASTISAPTSFNIGASFDVSITRANSGFTHTVRLKNGSTVGPSNTGQTTSSTFNTSGANATTLYGWTPNDNSKAITIECITYYGGVQVRTPTTRTITMKVVNSNPTFTNNWTYRDGASSVTSKTGQTGNSPVVVQSLSSIIVDISVANRAIAINGATMKSYTITVNGISKTVAWSNTAAIAFTYGATTSPSTNQTLTVEAIDSRGNKTSFSKTLTVAPYSKPILTSNVLRTNGFETESTLTASGSIQPVSISGVNKNSISKLQYRYKESTATFATPETGWTNIGYTGTGIPTFSGNNILFDTQLLQTKSYNFEMRLMDNFGTTTTVSKTVPVGQPIMFLDAVKKSIGINMFPTGDSCLEINTGLGSPTKGVILKGSMTSATLFTGTGGVVFQSNGTANLHLGQNNTSDLVFMADKLQFGSSKTLHFGNSMYGTTTPAIDLNNSDIVGANSIYFDDPTTSSAEALQFMRSTTPAGSFAAGDWDSFRVYDGTGFLNDKPIFSSDNQVLWSGTGYYMSEGQSVPPTKKLSECPNGWILVWSDYDAPSGQNWDWNYCLIHKAGPKAHSVWSIPTGETGTTCSKALTVSDTTLSGIANNADATKNPGCTDVVLRYVLSW